MRRICVDPGLACTGIAIVDGNTLIAHSHITTNPAHSLPTRLDQIGSGIAISCEANAILAARIELPPAAMSRPGRFARVMNATAIQGLTLATGAIIYSVSRYISTATIELVPPVGNLMIGGRKVRSDVKKKIACAVVQKRYGLAVNEHISEAILLGIPATTSEIAIAWMAVQPACVEKAQKRAQRRITKGGRRFHDR